MKYRIPSDIYYPLMFNALLHGLDEFLVFGLVKTESNFNPLAIGDEGHSFGLMQLHDAGAGAGQLPKNLLHVGTNCRIGCQFLAICIRETDSVEDGVSAYNQGVAGWRLRGRSINQKYVDAVLNWAAAFRERGIGELLPDDYLLRW